jgi:hypothetical protein
LNAGVSQTEDPTQRPRHSMRFRWLLA